jgi:hypothetical protein
MTSIRKALARVAPLRAAYGTLGSCTTTALCHLSPELLGRLRYWAAWGRWPHFGSPSTFDEKLLWLNLYWRHPLKAECGDKYTLRGYVEGLGLGHLLPRLYGVYESVEAIDFGALPECLVLKCSHGCKCNLFCRNKAEFDHKAARRDLRRWMGTDYSMLLGELHYGAMTPRIVCEEFLDDGTGFLPTDYKVFCFNGRPRWILCCTDRAPNGKGERVVVDVNWEPSAILRVAPPASLPQRPAALPEILAASAKLSAVFPFVRTDFYCIRGQAVLGEMTFTPNACINRDYAQHEMGRCLVLPQAVDRAWGCPDSC